MISDIEKFRLQNIRDFLFTYIKFLTKLLKNQTNIDQTQYLSVL